MSGTAVREPSLLSWTLSSLRPYKRQAVLLSVLLAIQIALGALQPWPLKLIIDNVLGDQPFRR